MQLQKKNQVWKNNMNGIRLTVKLNNCKITILFSYSLVFRRLERVQKEALCENRFAEFTKLKEQHQINENVLNLYLKTEFNSVIQNSMLDPSNENSNQMMINNDNNNNKLKINNTNSLDKRSSMIIVAEGDGSSVDAHYRRLSNALGDTTTKYRSNTNNMSSFVDKPKQTTGMCNDNGCNIF